MEKIIKINILFGYYGSLLSNKQKYVIDSYYNENLSMEEIAYNLNISKQAISNMLNRAVNKLNIIDKKLNLISKNEKIKNSILDAINCSKNPYVIDKLEKILREI